MGKRLTEEDMLDRIDFHADGGCWIWNGPKADGYGRVSFQGRYSSTHRWLYELCVEPIPLDMQLDHVCLNPSCCNPDHLEVVTQQENLRRRRPKPRNHPRYFPDKRPRLYKNIVRLLKEKHGKEWKDHWEGYFPWTVEGEPRGIHPGAED